VQTKVKLKGGISLKFEELINRTEAYVSLEHITVPRRFIGEGTLSIVVHVSDDFGALLQPQENKHLITTLQIDFPHHVMFSVIPDDFTEYDSSEKFIGDRFRIYTKSRQLKLAKTLIPHWKEDFPNKTLLHYSILCFEDNVEVLSFVEPEIKEIK
jgi:hypothetical protein